MFIKNTVYTAFSTLSLVYICTYGYIASYIQAVIQYASSLTWPEELGIGMNAEGFGMGT